MLSGLASAQQRVTAGGNRWVRARAEVNNHGCGGAWSLAHRGRGSLEPVRPLHVRSAQGSRGDAPLPTSLLQK